MSLFGSIQLANNALRANQVGLQVVGQNIANANTPGYIREEVNFQSAPTQRVGNLLLGLGVNVDGVVQKVDQFLEERLRGATSDAVSSDTQKQTFEQLEGLIAELGSTDLSTSLGNFFSSINEVLNQPESSSVRNLALLKGQTLAGDINRLAKRVGDLRSDVNDRVNNIANEINRLTENIRALNVRITEIEGGETSGSDAVGLRDQRQVALTNLSKLIDIRVQEQASGSVTVQAGGDFIVFEGEAREIVVDPSSDRGLTVGKLVFEDSSAVLQAGSGELAGVMTSRDKILGTFLDSLDGFARTLAFEFNKVYSSGQGLNGYHELTSEFAVSDATAALDAAGLSFTPVNGSFEIQVFNRKTGVTQRTQITVDLNGLDHDTSLTDLVSQLGAINGVSASIGPRGNLNIQSDSQDQEVAFGNDTSGLLAALGVNTFFSGTTASSLGVNQTVIDDPSKFAISKNGIGEDTANGVELAAFLDRALETQNGTTISGLYERLTADTTQASTVARSVAEGFKSFEESLRGQSLAISGVNIDEEAVKMLAFQRAFQASAKYIATLNELLGILVSL